MKELNNIFDQNTQVNPQLEVKGLDNFTKLSEIGGISLRAFSSIHDEDAGINGIIANILYVDWYDDYAEIGLDYYSAKQQKRQTRSELHISFRDPKGSYRKYIDRKGIRRAVLLNDSNTNNVRVVFRGSSIAIESVVMAAAIWTLGSRDKIPLRASYNCLCADVLNASGSKKSRERYGLKYDISPANLEPVSRKENSSRSSHRQHHFTSIKKKAMAMYGNK